MRDFRAIFRRDVAGRERRKTEETEGTEPLTLHPYSVSLRNTPFRAYGFFGVLAGSSSKRNFVTVIVPGPERTTSG